MIHKCQEYYPFVQSRCPGVVNMAQTWQEIVKSMASLANDMKKNMRTKVARHIANSSNNQQAPIITVPTNVTGTVMDAGDQRDSDL
ncbi:unnamed protein product [Didymodactylos carnosus]|uniref:Uncharacterized protein n=1 Tax=Didymodactylos carnosus TaxID=1234261 RepID=A0A8S2P540_9BILA|nr:unnamed protein product [Didymodactylos carnosus]CAF4036926.1 unnamed protein product [Didymodactylos carnosus]